MIATTQALMSGDRRVVDGFVAARKFWNEFFRLRRDWTIEHFREWFSIYQTRYESAIPNLERRLKQEIMVLTCLGSLNDETDINGDNRRLAITVAKGILTSTVSHEVKDYGRDAVRIYGLEKEVPEASEPF